MITGAIARAGSAKVPIVLSRLALWLGVVFLAAFFVCTGIDQVGDVYGQISRDYTSRSVPYFNYNDFPAFYAAADEATQLDGDLYDRDTMVRSILTVQGWPSEPDLDTSKGDYVWLRWYNPPLYLLALSPLTLLDLKTAYLMTLGLNLVLVGVLVLCLGRVLRWQQPQTLLLSLALFAYAPLYYGLHHAQPTILISILLAAGYLTLREGRQGRAGLLLALTGIKPHWLLPALTLLWREKRLRRPMLISATLLLGLPFLLYGPAAIFDYLRLVLDRGNSDLTNEDFTTALLSWTGFFRAYYGEPQPTLWLLASAATITAFVIVWRLADSGLVLAAGVLTALIAIPHSHPQDWILIAPVAAILLSRASRPVEYAGTSALLMAVFLGANDWPAAQWRMDHYGSSVYWVTPAAFGLLWWLAASLVTPPRVAGAQRAGVGMITSDLDSHSPHQSGPGRLRGQ